MRKVSETVGVTTGSWQQYYPPGTLYANHTLEQAYTEYREEIHTITKRGISRRFNPCYHKRYDGDINTASYSWSDWSGNWQMQTDNAFAYFASIQPDGLDPHVEGIDPIVFDWVAASARAYQAMKPSVSEGSALNLTMFLVEIRDLTRLADLWRRSYGFVKNLSRGYLNWEFGYKQAYRDLRDILRRTYDWQKRLESFLSKANEVQVRHYSEPVDVPLTYTKEWTILTDSHYPHPDNRKVVQLDGPPLYTATMEYDYSVPSYRFGDHEVKVRAFLDAFGLNLNPSTIWDLIPWSFVVDWFVGVGNVLESKEDSWLEPIMRIKRFCHSVKYSFTTMTECRRAMGPWTTVLRTTGKRYQRLNSIPDLGPVDFQSSDFTGRRVALATSLLTSR